MLDSVVILRGHPMDKIWTSIAHITFSLGLEKHHKVSIIEFSKIALGSDYLLN